MAIVITGASSGLGEAIALLYSLRPGSQLVIAARGKDQLDAVAEKCKSNGAEVLIVPTDVTEEDQCKNLVEQAIQRFGSIQVLILAAGVNLHAPFGHVKELHLYKKLMEVNYFGCMYPTFHALPHLRQSKGKIGVICSLSGELGLPFRSGYCASKFAVRGFFESLMTEIPSDEVGITIVSPGSVRTNMREHSLTSTAAIQFNEDVSKHMDPQECARQIVDAVDTGKRHVVLTFSGKMAVMLKPFFPSLVQYFAKKKAGGELRSKL
eukprot:TRINITY_DN10387_c0_g1_i1.p1 TRINITY_DN10387_c0_g1~~TRINITY_DN10387_c0_g1_i1.p1  ORF type:complete len:265 (+),score=45.54 TRINITY_DN10387_c0_g1_i1:177-971(+)